MSQRSQQQQIDDLKAQVDALKSIWDLDNRATSDGTEYFAVTLPDGSEYKMPITAMTGDGFRTITADYTLVLNDQLLKVILVNGNDITLTIPNDLAWKTSGGVKVIVYGSGFSIAGGDSVTINNPQSFQDVDKSTFDLIKTGANGFSVVQNGQTSTSGGGGTDTIQTAHTLSLLFDQNRYSTYGSTTNNQHTQSGDETYTFNLTGAVEGATRLLEIIGDGNDLIFPNTTRAILNNSDSLGTLTGKTYTTENGVNYFLIFWYTNGEVNLNISDATVTVADTTPPSFVTTPTTGLILDTSFDVNANIDEDGTIYAVVLADGATAPTSTEVIAGTGSGGSAAIATDNALDTSSGIVLNFTGLTASTAYDVYLTAQDTALNTMATPVKLDVSTIATITLPDLSSISPTRIYAPFKTEQTTKDYGIRITDGSGNDYDVFWNASGEIGMDSKIGNLGVPLTFDLQHYVDNIMSGTTAYISTLYCHLTSHTFGTPGNGFVIYDTTNGLNTINSKVQIKSLGTGVLVGAALSELDNGNSFSVLTAASNTVSNGQGAIFTNRTVSTGDYFHVACDRRTQKRAGIIRDIGSNFYFGDLSSQDDTSNTRRLVVTVNDGGNMVSYKNSSTQTTVSIAAQTGYTNETSSIASFASGGVYLTGHIAYVIICNTNISSSQVTTSDTELQLAL